MLNFVVCITVRLVLAVIVYFLVDWNMYGRGIMAALCGILLARLAYLFFNHTENQVATFDTSLQVTWNSLRPFHMLNLVIIATSALANLPTLAAATAAFDAITSAIVHNRKVQ